MSGNTMMNLMSDRFNPWYYQRIDDSYTYYWYGPNQIMIVVRENWNACVGEILDNGTTIHTVDLRGLSRKSALRIMVNRYQEYERKGFLQ